MSLLCAPVNSLKPTSLIKGSSLSLAGFPPATLTSRRQPRSVRCEAAPAQDNATLVQVDLSNATPVKADDKKNIPDHLPEILPPPLPKPTPTPTPTPTPVVPKIGRSSFPAGFAFGASTSALQIEGALHEDGRGTSIWETHAKNHPEKIADGSFPDVACDSYHRYKDDVKLLKQAGFDSYRFSIGWPRILPKGSLAGGINKAGIQYYSNLIDELIANGIQPYVTLFHWDVPQTLDDAYGGFLSKKIVEDFKDFAQICFQSFGDRVKYWITLNEPHMFCTGGYDNGMGAPGRCSPGCETGNSATEPYIVAHNLILAHAAVVRLYKDKFQHNQKGKIGITLNVDWQRSYSHSKQDIEAQQRSLDFTFGWYMDPIVYGDYPFAMRALVRDRLPVFTDEETKLITGSYDFLGLNYYSSKYAKSIAIPPNDVPVSYSKDSFADLLLEKEGVPIGLPVRCDNFYSCPEGIYSLLVYAKNKYKNPNIYITENGCFESDDNELSFEEALRDEDRTQYYAAHLANVLEAIRSGVRVKGFFGWSLMDNWEWISGYTKRLGIAYVDFNDRQNRYHKDSFRWFNKFLKI